VRERLPNSMFRVELEGGRQLTAHLAGDARATLTRLVTGDEVLVEVSDLDRASAASWEGSRGQRR